MSRTLCEILPHPIDRREYRAARARGESVSLAMRRVRTERACREVLTWQDADHDVWEYAVSVDALRRHADLSDAPEGTRIAVRVRPDESSHPEDFECYTDADVLAWSMDEWGFVGVDMIVILPDGRKGEAALCGIERGYYWPGSNEADIWHVVPELAGEALAEAIAQSTVTIALDVTVDVEAWQAIYGVLPFTPVLPEWLAAHVAAPPIVQGAPAVITAARVREAAR